MDRVVKFRNSDVHYRQMGDGSGEAVFLLHGYLESLEIWDGFDRILAEKYHVISLDLPGHGKSGIFGEVHHMDDLADAVLAVARHLDIPEFHLVGHSMGGYITMAFRERHYSSLISYVLFHSTCYSDNDEKKAARQREIDLVWQGKKNLIVNTNIPKAFADDNLIPLKKMVDRAKVIASLTPDAGIIAVLRGMMERPDRSRLIKEDKIPLLLIGGQKDNYIPYTKMEEMQSNGKNVDLAPLKNSGHMGFIEEPDMAAKILDNFFKQFA